MRWQQKTTCAVLLRVAIWSRPWLHIALCTWLSFIWLTLQFNLDSKTILLPASCVTKQVAYLKKKNLIYFIIKSLNYMLLRFTYSSKYHDITNSGIFHSVLCKLYLNVLQYNFHLSTKIIMNMMILFIHFLFALTQEYFQILWGLRLIQEALYKKKSEITYANLVWELIFT